LKEDCRKIEGRLEEIGGDWRKIGGRLEEDWRKIGGRSEKDGKKIVEDWKKIE